MKNVSLLFICLLLAGSVTAQKIPGAGPSIGRLYGKVVDASTKQPIAYASASAWLILPNGRDSLLGGGLTLENGDFNITGLPMGTFKVKISYMGNKEVVKTARLAAPNAISIDLGNLAMSPDAQMLSTVDVRADKATTSISLEKRVFNVEKNITATGGTAEDVLKNVPSVTVDMDGIAKLRDKDATIYVDGKPTLLSLNQIPSDQIESVEVISNPSAKYEAATMGGIVNIVLKKNRKPGFSGIANIGVGTQDRYNGMLNLNANLGKWNISAFYNLNASKAVTNAYVYRSNLEAGTSTVLDYFNQQSDVVYDNAFQSGRLNIDYALDNRNALSLSGTVSGGRFNIPVVQSYEYLSSERLRTGFGIRNTYSGNDFARNNVEAQWKKQFATPGKSLTTLLNYAWGTTSNAGNWNTSGFDAGGEMLPGFPELADIQGSGKNEQWVFQMDYVRPVNDSSKLEMGVRSFFSSRDQGYFFSDYDYATSAYLLNDLLSQDTRITENIQAAYVSYTGRWKYGIDYQAGVRFETSGMTGISRLEGTSDFGYQYPGSTARDVLRSLFPSLHVSKKLDERTELGLNFSRKIQRPNPRQLTPGVQANDKQNIQLGNPNLQPEFVNLAELNFNRIFGAHNWLSTMYVSNETNTLKPLTLPSEDDPTILITTFVNGKNELNYGLDNTLKLAFSKNLELMLNANVFHFNVAVDTFSNSGWTANAKAGVSYKLPAGFSFQLNGAFEGNRPNPQGTRQGVAFMDVAVKKTLFRNAANLVFSVNDVFDSRRNITILEQPTFYQEAMRRRDSRFFKVALQFAFGNADGLASRKGNKKQQVEEIPDFSGN